MMRLRYLVAAVTFAAVLAHGSPSVARADDRIRLGDSTDYVGLDVAEEVEVGSEVALELRFEAHGSLPDDIFIFVHIESQASTCRGVRDVAARADGDGVIAREIRVPLPAGGVCGPQRMDIYTGLYRRSTGERLAVTGSATTDDRIHAGHFDLVDSAASEERTRITPGQMGWQRMLSLLSPWRWWGAGLLVMIALAAVLRRRWPAAEHVPLPLPTGRRARLIASAPLLFAAVVLVLSILVALDFVKDDAYITFRYAQNLIAGNGLVFNVGERVEASTTFLWIFVVAPFEAMGLDLFQVLEVVGTALCLGLLACMAALFVNVYGVERSGAYGWALLWLAASSSVARWTTSGMEQPLAMFLPMAALLVTFAGMDRGSRRLALGGGVLMGLGCITRPEIHLIGAVLSLPLLVRCVRARKVDPVAGLWFAGLLGVTAPVHLFRLIYYGDLLPNTYYVKTSTSSLVWLAGLRKLREMFDFNAMGALVLAAPFAFADRAARALKLVMVGIVVGFMVYIVKVGADEMSWHRLYLPALPFLCVLAAMGVRNLVVALGAWFASRPRVGQGAVVVAWLMFLGAAIGSFQFSYGSTGGFNGRADLSGTYHPDMGKFLVRHERPGALVAFQDMGSTPYHAQDLSFLDFIGLTDRTVGRARHAYGLHPFARTESFRNQPRYDADMRDYFYERNPEWVILTSYIGAGQMNAVAANFATSPTPASLGWAIGSNPYQFGIWQPRFQEQYQHVRTWPRSRAYYLSLFRRRDLWDQVPGEVVLDVVPEGIGGVTAQFERGLELLGSEMQSEAREMHEFYLTTWWRAAGPAEVDTHFFVHVEREGHRTAYDHIPGDSMYPANRWRPGDIIENRVLVQLPYGLWPGEYSVRMGIYRRSTGERWAITQGPDDGQNRLELGTLTVRAQRPYIDATILTTDLALHRKYPDRIVDHGRAPGE